MSGVRTYTNLVICAGLFSFGVFTYACSSSKPAPAPKPAQELWGDLKPVVSVKELMRDMLDPASDYVFDSVGTFISKKGGRVEREPKTDADWDKIRIGAVTLAEGGISAQDSPALRAAWRREQQHRPGAGGTVAGSNQGQARSRPGVVECENRSAAERRARGDGDCEEERREGVVGRRREPRSGVRELSPRILVSRRKGAAEEARFPSGRTLRTARRQKPQARDGN